MKLERLAGYGPTAALVSGGSLFIALFILIFGPGIHPAWDGVAVAMVVVAALAATLWPLSLVVVGLDLEWLEHPDTHTGRLRFSLWAAFLGAFCPLFFALVLIVANNSFLPALPLAVLAADMAIFLIIQNREARKAGLLKGVLPVIGYIAGGGFTLMALGFATSLLSPLAFGLGLIGFFTGTVSFVFWSIWLGLRLHGEKNAVPIAASPA